MEQRIKVSIYLHFRRVQLCFSKKIIIIANTKRGGVMKIHVDKGRGLEKCPLLSTKGGEGVKNRQNLVHVVIEWPQVHIKG